jgi:hypothetical protein
MIPPAIVIYYLGVLVDCLCSTDQTAVIVAIPVPRKAGSVSCAVRDAA